MWWWVFAIIWLLRNQHLSIVNDCNPESGTTLQWNLLGSSSSFCAIHNISKSLSLFKVLKLKNPFQLNLYWCTTRTVCMWIAEICRKFFSMFLWDFQNVSWQHLLNGIWHFSNISIFLAGGGLYSMLLTQSYFCANLQGVFVRESATCQYQKYWYVWKVSYAL